MMARNSRLALAMMASLNQRALNAVVASGELSKADLATIPALSANGGAHDEIAKCIGGKVLHDRTVRKLGRAIGQYTKQRLQEMTPMVTTTTDLLQERVAKSRDVQKMLSDAIKADQAAHPGRRREDSIDAVLYGSGVRKIVELEHQLDESVAKARNTLPQDRPVPEAPPLPQDRPGTMRRTHNSGPVLGQTGYDPSKDVRRPATATATGGPQESVGDVNPIIRDHHQTLADIASGKINETDPKFRALRALEMKRLYAKD